MESVPEPIALASTVSSLLGSMGVTNEAAHLNYGVDEPIPNLRGLFNAPKEVRELAQRMAVEKYQFAVDQFQKDVKKVASIVFDDLVCMRVLNLSTME